MEEQAQAPTGELASTSTAPVTSTSEMPPLAPAPAQLPPLVHPPPLAPVSVQFETLSLNTPLQPIPPLPDCSSPTNGELSPAEKLVNDQLAANASGDASLVGEAGKRGVYIQLIWNRMETWAIV